MKRTIKSREQSVKAKKTIDEYFGKSSTTVNPVTEQRLLWNKITSENLDCDMLNLFSKSEAEKLFSRIEECVEYNVGKMAQVRLYGRWIDIPRKQAAFGDKGLTYTFSGNTIPARPWLPVLTEIKNKVENALSNNWNFNFVLVNKYEDGNAHIGEHRDDEKELNSEAPIASVSLGQERDFVLRHKDARGKNQSRTDLKPITMALKSGTLLLLNPPTNAYWYHSLPVRKRARFPRINLTFRVMLQKAKRDSH